jgi:nucleoside-diphosphate kinase
MVNFTSELIGYKMKSNRTFMMIKPSTVKAGLEGKILSMIQEAGFRIVSVKKVHITESMAGIFYGVHKGKPFYDDLVAFMSSGPVIAAILEKDNAIEEFRTLIGATDPSKAQAGTIRKLYGMSVRENAVHGSDSDENAAIESAFFFSGLEQF